MTPMIDVTFLLIIFFLVSSHLAKQENFTKLELPIATAGTPDFSDRPTLTIQVLASGEYQIAGQTMPLDQVRRSILARKKVDEAMLRVRIRTDRQTDYEHIGALLKICAITGVNDVFFAVYEERTQ